MTLDGALDRVEYQPNGCWVWRGAKSGQGYGHIVERGRKLMAHRWIYERKVGPIPEGLELDHLCRVPLCVNPAHLEPVPHQVNIQRGQIAHQYGESNGAAKLSDVQVAEIRRREGEPVKALAREFGISDTYVRMLHRGEWRTSLKASTAEGTG